MNQETFNMDLRKFLKKVGVTSQHEIENAVTEAINSGVLRGNEKLEAKVTLTIDMIDLNYDVRGVISLE